MIAGLFYFNHDNVCEAGAIICIQFVANYIRFGTSQLVLMHIFILIFFYFQLLCHPLETTSLYSSENK